MPKATAIEVTLECREESRLAPERAARFRRRLARRIADEFGAALVASEQGAVSSEQVGSDHDSPRGLGPQAADAATATTESSGVAESRPAAPRHRGGAADPGRGAIE